MKNQKSPGSDGITVEFYKLFWNDVKEFYINSINYSFQTGSLTDLQKQSIITLLPTQNKDITSLENWRPISLLNVDYKIATKAIANRVKGVISSLVHNSQTGFIKERYIGENIRLLFEIIDNDEDENKPGLIFFSDFEKAFDSINHTFITHCLKHFNFGEDFIRWLNLFIMTPKAVSQIMVTCRISSPYCEVLDRDVHFLPIYLLCVLSYFHIKFQQQKI